MSFDANMAELVMFMLVLARVAGLVTVAPGFGSQALPMQVRAFLAIAIALLIAPLQDAAIVRVPENLGQLTWMTANELGVGLFLGFGVNLIFSSAQLAGQLIGQMSGMQASDVFNPTLGTSVPLFAQMIDTLMLVVFIAVGGHQLVLAALLDTFGQMPVSQVRWEVGELPVLIRLLAESFALGLKIGAPVMVAMIISLLVLGLISRTLPQLNVIQVGFSLNSMLMLLVAGVSLGAGLRLFDDQIFSSIDQVRDALIGANQVSRP